MEKMKKVEFIDFVGDLVKEHFGEKIPKTKIKEFHDDFNKKFMDELKERGAIQTYLCTFEVVDVRANPSKIEEEPIFTKTLRIKASTTSKKLVRE